MLTTHKHTSKLTMNNLLLNPCSQFGFLPFSIPTTIIKQHSTNRLTISAAATTINDSTKTSLTAKERRQLRNERRESKNWKEEVEDKLLIKPKKRYASWTEELNLDNLALLGPQWWILRVSRVSPQYTVDRLTTLLIRCYPQFHFKIYSPVVQVKKILKNVTISVKPKALFPGCVFLRCEMNKEMHDFIKECEGVGGIIGSVVGNTKKQINRPKPVSVEAIEAITRQAKVEQEKADKAFEEEQQQGDVMESMLKIEAYSDSKDVTESVIVSKPRGRSQKVSKKLADAPSLGKDDKLLRPGSTVQVLSGTFAEFSGTLKKVDRKIAKVTVAFTLFGKETLVDLGISEVALKPAK